MRVVAGENCALTTAWKCVQSTITIAAMRHRGSNLFVGPLARGCKLRPHTEQRLTGGGDPHRHAHRHRRVSCAGFVRHYRRDGSSATEHNGPCKHPLMCSVARMSAGTVGVRPSQY